MILKRMGILLACLALTMFSAACADESENDESKAGSGDAEGDVTIDGEGVEDADDQAGVADDQGGDTPEQDMFRGEPCEELDPDPKNYDYGADYPTGPYGFKGGLCWSDTSDVEWKGGGDTLHNFCYPNQDDEEFCFGDLRETDHDILIIGVSARWCPICNIAASQEKRFLNDLRAAGWNPIFVTILVQGMSQEKLATVADAKAWHNGKKVEFDTLYTPETEFIDKAFFDMWTVGRRELGMVGFPVFFYVNPQTMRVWDTWQSWPIGQYASWIDQELELLDMIRDLPGS